MLLLCSREVVLCPYYEESISNQTVEADSPASGNPEILQNHGGKEKGTKQKEKVRTILGKVFLKTKKKSSNWLKCCRCLETYILPMRHIVFRLSKFKHIHEVILNKPN